ncbi:heavy metal translocating P-type ATPase [Natrialbaceae archaeon A-CW3]
MTEPRDHERTPSEQCSVCGRDDTDPTLTLEGATASFCSIGCRNVWDTVGPITEPSSPTPRTISQHTSGSNSSSPSDSDIDETASQVADASIAGASAGDASIDDHEVEDDDETTTEDEPGGNRRTFLRIDGMRTITCEAFLESVARDQPGVVDAEASHVTESIRVTYDPAGCTDEALEDALSTLGYTAYLRENAEGSGTAATTGETRRAREMSGIRKRRTEDMMDVRYILGVVFGSFLLLPYVTMLYPAYLAPFLPNSPLHTFEELFTDSGVLFLRVYFVLTGIVLYITGKPLLRGAYISLKMRRPTVDLLAAVTIVSAFCYSTVAVLAGHTHVYFDLVIVIAALVMGALLYESQVKRRALDTLTALTISQVDTAHRYEADGRTTDVPVHTLEPAETVLVKQGERIPVDGVLEEGPCTVDEAIMTGESVPITKTAGDDVIGGSVVIGGAAVISVGEQGASSIDRLTETVWNLQSATHGIHRRVDARAGRVLAGLGVLTVFVAVVTLLLGGGVDDALLAALAVSFVASPWLIGVATPLSIATAIEAALDRGIAVFDATVFGRIAAVDTVVFDKTGTLTSGEMTVLDADAPSATLSAAAALERRAAHPAGEAIVRAFGNAERESDESSIEPDGGSPTSPTQPTDTSHEVSEFTNHATGVEGVVDGSRVLVGHPGLFDDRGWSVSEELEAQARSARTGGRLPILVGTDGAADGVVVVGDEPRTDWGETITSLSERDLEVLVMTGDDAEATATFDEHPHVAATIAGVSPAGKVAAIEQLRRESSVAMIGDGTNDAPALAEADLGISLGSGTDLASDAGDLAIANDDLEAIETAFEVATVAEHRMRQNTRLALSYNAIVIPFALLGLLNPLVAMVAVVVAAGMVIINAFRPYL